MAYANRLHDPRDKFDPGRQVPLFRPASAVMRRPAAAPPTSAPFIVGITPGHAAAIPSALDLAQQEVRNALAALGETFRAYRTACGQLGEANRRTIDTGTPAFIRAAVERAGGFIAPVILTAEEVRERRATAMRRINHLRAALRRCDRRLAAARAALAGLEG